MSIVDMFVKQAFLAIDEDLAHLGGAHTDEQAEYLKKLMAGLRERQEAVGVAGRNPPA